MLLNINEIEITMDDDGRYSLNDLHNAAGGLKKDVPTKFTRSESFKNVVKVLNDQKRAVSPIEKKQGRYSGGTWVCRELVYKYAMWVSAEFEVKVIQTFDAMIQSVNAPATMKALNELTLKIEGDKYTASKIGSALANYKKVKKENAKKWVDAVNEIQLNFGFDNLINSDPVNKLNELNKGKL